MPSAANGFPLTARPLQHPHFRTVRKHQTEEIQQVVGSLDFDHVAAAEIHRRLREGDAGLPYKVDISLRQVYNYRQKYRDVHGLPSNETSPDARQESIDSIKDRMVQLVSRELAVLERRRPGKMTRADFALVKDFHKTMQEWKRREASVVGRLPQNQIAPGDRKQTAPKEESAIEKLAREEREQRTKEAMPTAEAMAAA